MLNRLSRRLSTFIGRDSDQRNQSDGDCDHLTTEPAPNPEIWEEVLEQDDPTETLSPRPGDDKDTRHTTDQMTDPEQSEMEGASSDEDAASAGSYDSADDVAHDEDSRSVGDHDPINKETPGNKPGQSAVEQDTEHADDPSAVEGEGESMGESDPTSTGSADLVESPISEVGVDGSIKPDDYIDKLEEKVSDLKDTVESREETIEDLEQTVDEKNSTIESLRTVTPGLDDMHNEPMSVGLYIETLEDHIERLDSQLDRKKSVIQELKDNQSELRQEVRKETTMDLFSEFLNKLPAQLVRGTEQLDDVPTGMKTTINQFDDLLREYDGEVIEPTPGNEIDQDIHKVRGKEPGEFADGTVNLVEERGLRIEGEIVKLPVVIMTEGTLDEGSADSDTEGSAETEAEALSEATTDHDSELAAGETLGQPDGFDDQQDCEFTAAETVESERGKGRQNADTVSDDGKQINDTNESPTE